VANEQTYLSCVDIWPPTSEPVIVTGSQEGFSNTQYYKESHFNFQIRTTAILRYNAVRLALIRHYAAVAFQPFLGMAPFPPAVTLFVSTAF
jgi:hypothetical protein